MPVYGFAVIRQLRKILTSEKTSGNVWRKLATKSSHLPGMRQIVPLKLPLLQLPANLIIDQLESERGRQLHWKPDQHERRFLAACVSRFFVPENHCLACALEGFVEISFIELLCAQGSQKVRIAGEGNEILSCLGCVCS